jgi:hypothetical protein
MKKAATILFLLLFSAAPLLAEELKSSVETVAEEETLKFEDNYLLEKYGFKDNWFFSFHLGSFVNWGSNLKDFDLNRFRPSVGVSLGKWFFPQVGMRTQFLYGGNRGETTLGHRPYHFHTLELACDGLVNFSNIVSRYREDRKFNFLLLLGIGGDQTFGFSKRDWNVNESHFDRGACTLLTFRAGLMCFYEISQKWDLSFELVNNWLDDSYDGIITNNRWDGHVNANIGLIRRFRNHDEGYKFKYIGLEPAMFEDANNEINRLRMEADRLKNLPPEEINGGRQTNTLVSFVDTVAVIDEMQEVNVFTAVQAMRQYENKVNLFITTLSQMSDDMFLKRADTIKDVLVNQYGLPANQIIIEKDPAEVEKRDKVEGSVIIYMNESKSK